MQNIQQSTCNKQATLYKPPPILNKSLKLSVKCNKMLDFPSVSPLTKYMSTKPPIT